MVNPMKVGIDYLCLLICKRVDLKAKEGLHEHNEIKYLGESTEETLGKTGLVYREM